MSSNIFSNVAVILLALLSPGVGLVMATIVLFFVFSTLTFFSLRSLSTISYSCILLLFTIRFPLSRSLVTPSSGRTLGLPRVLFPSTFRASDLFPYNHLMRYYTCLNFASSPYRTTRFYIGTILTLSAPLWSISPKYLRQRWVSATSTAVLLVFQ